MKANIRKYYGRLDSDHSQRVALDLPFDLPLKGRGWGKLNHQHIYDLCETKGLDLQEPDFLGGRFMIFERAMS